MAVDDVLDAEEPDDPDEPVDEVDDEAPDVLEAEEGEDDGVDAAPSFFVPEPSAAAGAEAVLAAARESVL